MRNRIKKLMAPTSSPLKRNIGYDEDEEEAKAERNKHKNAGTSSQSAALEVDVIMQENDPRGI
jgi:hypothetical protein